MTLKLPVFNMPTDPGPKAPLPDRGQKTNEPFRSEKVRLSSLSQKMRALIRYGKGMARYKNDRSAALLAACHAMLGKYSDQEIVSTLIDRNNFLGEVAYDHVKSNSREKASKWILKYTLGKAKRQREADSGFESKAKISSIAPEMGLQLTFERFEEVTLDQSYAALVEDLIDHHSFVVLYGKSNSGKTFLALDLALHIALGRTWQQRKVEGGPVLYVAAEGGRRIKDRVVAFRKVYALEEMLVPFRLARGTIDLLDPETDTQPLIDEILKTQQIYGAAVLLVVIDTLSRALSGGDENASTDMGAIVKNIDRIRQETGATVLAVHHCGKDENKGARGHSILRAAVDTELEISDAKKFPGIKLIRPTKQRDFDCGTALSFQLESVEIGKTGDGKAITSCTVKHVGFDAVRDFLSKPIKPESVPGKALAILQAAISENVDGKDGISVEEWRKRFVEKHYKQSPRQTQSHAFKSAQKRLTETDTIKIEDGYVRLR